MGDPRGSKVFSEQTSVHMSRCVGHMTFLTNLETKSPFHQNGRNSTSVSGERFLPGH